MNTTSTKKLISFSNLLILLELLHQLQKNSLGDFPVVKNPPCSAEDKSLMPGRGPKPMCLTQRVRAPQQKTHKTQQESHNQDPVCRNEDPITNPDTAK